MRRILVADDEDAIREFVAINLERQGYEVIAVPSGDVALMAFTEEKGNFDIVLLDIMMPGMDGLSLCKELRRCSDKVGIIMVSAKNQEMDKVGALMYGADDYITKPFDLSELLARVDALYRRVNMVTAPVFEEDNGVHSGPFVLNPRARTLTKYGKLIELTQTEFQIMDYLLQNPNVNLSRQQIFEEVWKSDCFADIKIVDVNIRRLRMKIEVEPSNPQYLATVWGFGYRWDVH